MRFLKDTVYGTGMGPKSNSMIEVSITPTFKAQQQPRFFRTLAILDTYLPDMWVLPTAL
jgi:hypothetical protein